MCDAPVRIGDVTGRPMGKSRQSRSDWTIMSQLGFSGVDFDHELLTLMVSLLPLLVGGSQSCSSRVVGC